MINVFHKLTISTTVKDHVISHTRNTATQIKTMINYTTQALSNVRCITNTVTMLQNHV